VSGDFDLLGCDYVVPGDISAAAFFLVAAACLDGSDITMRHIGLNPTRADIIGVLKGFGARIDGYEGARTETPHESDTEPAGDIRVRSGFDTGEPGGSNVIGGKLIPKVIDEIPVLGVLGTQLRDGIAVRDAAELRVKESDRISAVVENLRRMNADVEEFKDGFRVRRSRLSGARVDSYGDHRIAMAFSIAGLLAEGETEIDGAECAAVSFPGFFDQLQNVAIYE
jgi:3-phosphoshikimate 1-carboxyvinyltransferase